LLPDHHVQTQNGLLFEDRSNSQYLPVLLGTFRREKIEKAVEPSHDRALVLVLVSIAWI
jgi:hypothetical protein